MEESHPFISILIPCYQEREFIVQFLESILSQDYPHECFEVLIAEGYSTDGTREIILNYIKSYDFFKLIDNPLKNQTLGLNLALKASKGEIIVRMDVHAIYPVNYISTLIRAQKRLQAWNVGCPWETVPSENTAAAFVIASALAMPFGVGNSRYRTGIVTEKSVDTVPFGCFPRNIFEKIGLFNEKLLKNEDDEFNARIIKSGGKIFLLPSPVITYFARNTREKLFRMLYQYGYFKPAVNFSIGNLISVRQIFPPLFVLYLLLIPFITIISDIDNMYLILLIPLILYLIMLIAYSWKIAFMKSHTFSKSKILFLGIITFPGMHFSYGLGYLSGLVNFLRGNIYKSKKVVESTR